MIVLYGIAADDPPDLANSRSFMLRIREKLRALGLPTPVTRQRAAGS
jgi:hypothetical protein